MEVEFMYNYETLKKDLNSNIKYSFLAFFIVTICFALNIFWIIKDKQSHSANSEFERFMWALYTTIITLCIFLEGKNVVVAFLEKKSYTFMYDKIIQNELENNDMIEVTRYSIRYIKKHIKKGEKKKYFSFLMDKEEKIRFFACLKKDMIKVYKIVGDGEEIISYDMTYRTFLKFFYVNI